MVDLPLVGTKWKCRDCGNECEVIPNGLHIYEKGIVAQPSQRMFGVELKPPCQCEFIAKPITEIDWTKLEKIPKITLGGE